MYVARCAHVWWCSYTRQFNLLPVSGNVLRFNLLYPWFNSRVDSRVAVPDQVQRRHCRAALARIVLSGCLPSRCADSSWPCSSHSPGVDLVSFLLYPRPGSMSATVWGAVPLQNHSFGAAPKPGIGWWQSGCRRIFGDAGCHVCKEHRFYIMTAPSGPAGHRPGPATPRCRRRAAP
jgi:hypothetical protein